VIASKISIVVYWMKEDMMSKVVESFKLSMLRNSLCVRLHELRGLKTYILVKPAH
jgi:hypothetical protein